MFGSEVFLKVKLLPKSNIGFICECIWVKPSCKSIITMKEALLRFTVVSFSGKLIFHGALGHSDASIKIAIFKTLRRLDTTWNFACSITWTRALGTLFVYTEFTKKKDFEQHTLAAVSSACRCHGRHKVSIPSATFEPQSHKVFAQICIWSEIVHGIWGSTLFVSHDGSSSEMRLLTFVFMCRDPGDTTSKVHVVSSFLSVLIIASVRVPLHSNENELARKWNYRKS